MRARCADEVDRPNRYCMFQTHEVFLKRDRLACAIHDSAVDRSVVSQHDVGRHSVVTHRHDSTRHLPCLCELAGNGTGGGTFGQARGAIQVCCKVTITQVEPVIRGSTACRANFRIVGE